VLMTRTQGSGWRRVTLDSSAPARYSVTLASLREDTWYFALGGGARSARYLARVLTPPVVRSLRAAYTYPAYTARPPASETVGEQGIHALQNTRVALEVAANRPLAAGQLSVRTEDGRVEDVPLQPGRDPTRATGGFALTA